MLKAGVWGFLIALYLRFGLEPTGSGLTQCQLRADGDLAGLAKADQLTLLQKLEDANFLRGYGYQVEPIRPDWEVTFNHRGFGADYKDSLLRPSPFWIWAMRAFIECLPSHDNRVYLHANKKDRFGIPQIAAEFQWSDNERNAAQDTGVQAAKIMRATGAVYMEISDGETLDEGGDAIHEMGTARMGEDPSTSVLNKYNQAHEIDNLFVTDGSFMASASCVNPSLTYMAFTARAVAYAVKQLQEGKLG